MLVDIYVHVCVHVFCLPVIAFTGSLQTDLMLIFSILCFLTVFVIMVLGIIVRVLSTGHIDLQS